MQNNAVLKIVMKIVIVALSIAVYLVIVKQAEIRADEDAARDLSREKMSIIKEALNHYAQINKEYTSNFDTLLISVQTDSILNQKKLRVKLTTELLDAVEVAKENPLYSNVFEIKKAIKELHGILEEVSDSYKQSPEIMELNLSITEDIQSFENQNDFFDFASILNISDSLNYLSIEVNAFTLQEAVEKSKNFLLLFKSHAPNIDMPNVTKYWNTINSDLKSLEAKLTDPKQPVQVFTNRYLKHMEVIQKRLADLNKLNIDSEAAKFDAYSNDISNIGDKFTSQYFSVTSRSALKGLEKDEQILVKIDENTILAPPLNKDRYKIEITNGGLGYIISCPNPEQTKEFSVGLFSQRYKNYGSINTGEKSWEAN